MSVDQVLLWVHIAGFGLVVVLSVDHLRYVSRGSLAVLTLVIMRLLSAASLCGIFIAFELGIMLDTRLTIGPLPLLIWIVYVFDIRLAPDRLVRRPEVVEQLLNGRDDA